MDYFKTIQIIKLDSFPQVVSENRVTKGLQKGDFRLNSPPMSSRKQFFALLCAAIMTLSVVNTAAASEQPGLEESSLFERYATSAQDLILKGLELVGINYRRGGTNPEQGLDCSGYVQVVFKEAIGKLLPRTAREQSQVGDAIDRNELKPGDLVFFNTMRHAFSHVGIYLGDNHFVHAPRTGTEIRVENMNQSYWVKRYNGARRILENK